MTDAQATRPRRRPPAAANNLMKAMLRSPLHGLLSKNIMLITFTGRKSGQQFTTPVSYMREGDTVTCFTDGRWWKNLQNGAQVTLRVQGKDLRGIAMPITDATEVAKGAQAYLLRNGGVKSAWRILLNLPKDHEPTMDELIAAATGLTMIRTQLA